MSVVLNVVSAVFWGVIVLSLLVFVHEGGHFLAARALGVRVTEFFLGLPCRWRISAKSKKLGTEYGVTLFLMGGYNRICGLAGVSDPLLAPALELIMARGRITGEELAAELGCDLECAYRLFEILADWGSIRPYYNPDLGEDPNQKDWPAAFETLARDASLLTEYDRGHDFTTSGSTATGEPHPINMDAEKFLAQERSHTYLGANFFGRLFMLLAGPAVNILLALLIVAGSLMYTGVSYVKNVSTVSSVDAGSYAEASGLQANDTITALDDQAISTWSELLGALTPYLENGQDFTLTVKREEETLTLDVDLPDGQAVSLFGINAQTEIYHPSFPEAAHYAVAYAKQVATYAFKLIVPTQTMEVLNRSSSVVGISVMASQAASSGPNTLIQYIAALSMSLGFMNLLPIPPLDGGKILIEAIQLVIRRDLSLKVQNIITYVGLAFFLFIFVFVLRNDILNIVIR